MNTSTSNWTRLNEVSPVPSPCVHRPLLGVPKLLVVTLLSPFLPAVNVNKIKDFGEAAKREMLMDRHAFETARRLSHDAMEEKVPWVYPKLLDLPAPLVVPGSGSRERFTQAEREKGILQEIFLSKER